METVLYNAFVRTWQLLEALCDVFLKVIIINSRVIFSIQTVIFNSNHSSLTFNNCYQGHKHLPAIKALCALSNQPASTSANTFLFSFHFIQCNKKSDDNNKKQERCAFE